jgi:hypothetical protein
MTPSVVFMRLAPDAPEPTPADPALGGSIPLRAYQHCIPFTQASGFGWHVYPPIDFSLLWDGNAFVWKPAGAQKWIPLVAAQMPGFSAWFAEHAPAEHRQLEPPFLSAFPEQGVVQVWSGYAARTRRGWSLLIRSPVNAVGNAVYDCLEGIVEHDWWCGPIISNLRFKVADREVRFQRSKPLFQLLPIPRIAYSKRVLGGLQLKASFEEFTQEDWSLLSEAIFPDGKLKERPGSYARQVRKRSR